MSANRRDRAGSPHFPASSPRTCDLERLYQQPADDPGWGYRILDDWRWRQDGIVQELLHYKQKLLALLNQEFEIDWRDDRPELPRDDGLPALVSTMPRDYGRLTSPFACWMEYTMLPGEQSVLDRHTNHLQASEMALKQRWVELFRDLLLLRWPEAAQRTTSCSRLRALGLGEPLSALDFC